MSTTRDETIRAIRSALRRRTGRPWSVTGGRGTAYGWLRISSPPARRTDPYGYMTEADRRDLAAALGMETPVHQQGVMVPAGHDYYAEYIDRAEGRTPSRVGVPYWD